LKGKILHGKRDAYNPLAPGDSVEVEIDGKNPSASMILSRNTRKNGFTRWNKKRSSPQIIAANIDACFCITSPERPPFRPRFIDRVMVMAATTEIPVTVVCNKSDQTFTEQILERLAVYEEIGYPVLFCSAINSNGIEDIRHGIEGKRVLFIGQSGVGKSTLLNALMPGALQKTAQVSDKHNRGKHTTVYSILLNTADFEIIDTPGIREIEIYGMEPTDLDHYFPEMDTYAGGCRYMSCTHDEEPGCAVKNGVEEGIIHPDRYESYIRMLYDIKMREPMYG